MLKCKTCGAEMQNPFDRYGETAITWLGIHSRIPHEIEGDRYILLNIEYIYKRHHDKYGRRIE